MLTTPKTVWDGHITMSLEKRRVVVKVNGVCLADSTDAIQFCEGDRAPIYYIPISDVDRSNLVASTLLTHCRWKGEASYLTYKSEQQTVENILWMYPHAHTPVAEIRDCVSFDVSKVIVTVLER